MNRLVADKKTFLEILNELPGLKKFWVESDDITGWLKIGLNEEALLTWAATTDSHLTIRIIINVYSIWVALLGYYNESTDNCDYIIRKLTRLKSLAKPVGTLE